MGEPNNKYHEMHGAQRFIDAIRSITGNPTMDKQQCEEWIEKVSYQLNMLPLSKRYFSDIGFRNAR